MSATLGRRGINRAWRTALGLVIILLAFWQTRSAPKPNDGPRSDNLYSVIKVVDGDTIEIDYYGQPTKLRLIGIDTPEVVDPRKTVQCFGREASNHAHELLDGSKVRIETDPLVGELDKYGRKLAYVFMANGDNFGELMIRQGYANEYTYQSQAYKYQELYKEAALDAETNGRGLWSASTCGGDTSKSALGRQRRG